MQAQPRSWRLRLTRKALGSPRPTPTGGCGFGIRRARLHWMRCLLTTRPSRSCGSAPTAGPSSPVAKTARRESGILNRGHPWRSSHTGSPRVTSSSAPAGGTSPLRAKTAQPGSGTPERYDRLASRWRTAHGLIAWRSVRRVPSSRRGASTGPRACGTRQPDCRSDQRSRTRVWFARSSLLPTASGWQQLALMVTRTCGACPNRYRETLSESRAGLESQRSSISMKATASAPSTNWRCGNCGGGFRSWVERR